MSVRTSTWASYEQTFRTHILPTFKDKKLATIKPLDVQTWIGRLSEGGVSPATTSKAYRCLRACLNDAVALEEIEKNPCGRKIQLPRPRHRELAFLEPFDIDILLDRIEGPERQLIMILAQSGLRLGEALALTWRHLDLAKNQITVERSWSAAGGFQDPKTRTSRRAVQMMPRLNQALQDYYASQGMPGPDSLLFSTGNGKPIDPGNLRRLFYRALEECNLKHVSLHSLRHSYASFMLASGASIVALQRSLGHADATMTLNTYAHLIPEDLGGALLRANQLFSGVGTVTPINLASTGVEDAVAGNR
jgi:integrase